MANTASARKRIRQNNAAPSAITARKSRMRTFVKKVETAIAGGDKAAATEALRAAQPEMQRAAGKGVTHPTRLRVSSRGCRRASRRYREPEQTGPVVPADDCRISRNDAQHVLASDQPATAAARYANKDSTHNPVCPTIDPKSSCFYFHDRRPQFPIAACSGHDIIITSRSSLPWSALISIDGSGRHIGGGHRAGAAAQYRRDWGLDAWRRGAASWSTICPRRWSGKPWISRN